MASMHFALKELVLTTMSNCQLLGLVSIACCAYLLLACTSPVARFPVVEAQSSVPVLVRGPSIVSTPNIDTDLDGRPDTYGPTEAIVVEVTFSEQVCGVGRVALTFQTGNGPEVTRHAEYSRCGGIDEDYVKFSYLVTPEDVDTDGISIAANSVHVVTYDRVVPVVTHGTVGPDTNHRVDGRLRDVTPPKLKKPPSIFGRRPVDGIYWVGDTIRVRADFSEDIVVDTGGGAPTLSLTLGGEFRKAEYVPEESDNRRMTFAYTVESGDEFADDLICVPASVNEVRAGFGVPFGSSITDTAGIAADLMWTVTECFDGVVSQSGSTPTPEPTDTPEPAETHTPTPTLEPTDTPEPAETHTPTPTLEPTDTPEPAETHTPTPTLEPKDTPVPAATPMPTSTLEPTDTPEPAVTPVPTPALEPTVTLEPTRTSEPTHPLGSSRLQVSVAKGLPDLKVVTVDAVPRLTEHMQETGCRRSPGSVSHTMEIEVWIANVGDADSDSFKATLNHETLGASLGLRSQENWRIVKSLIYDPGVNEISVAVDLDDEVEEIEEIENNALNLLISQPTPPPLCTPTPTPSPPPTSILPPSPTPQFESVDDDENGDPCHNVWFFYPSDGSTDYMCLALFAIYFNSVGFVLTVIGAIIAVSGIIGAIYRLVKRVPRVRSEDDDSLDDDNRGVTQGSIQSVDGACPSLIRGNRSDEPSIDDNRSVTLGLRPSDGADADTSLCRGIRSDEPCVDDDNRGVTQAFNTERRRRC